MRLYENIYFCYISNFTYKNKQFPLTKKEMMKIKNKTAFG